MEVMKCMYVLLQLYMNTFEYNTFDIDYSVPLTVENFGGSLSKNILADWLLCTANQLGQKLLADKTLMG